MSQLTDKKILGLVLALACYATYSLHYATMKWLDAHYSLWQLMFVRSLVMFVITLGIGRMATVKAFVASPYKLPTALRGALQFLSAMFFYVAASSMPLTDVTTIYSAAPLMIVLLSIVVLGERIGGFHWLAVLIGLAGTVIAANPGDSAALLPALYALASAFTWAVTVVYTRKSGGRESSDVQLLSASLVFMALSAGFMTWQTPDLTDCALMLALGVQIYLAHLFFLEACRFAPASLIGPTEYSSVVWACLFGFLMFAEIPTPGVLLGAALVVLSGLALASGMRRAAKKDPPVLAAAETAGS